MKKLLFILFIINISCSKNSNESLDLFKERYQGKYITEGTVSFIVEFDKSFSIQAYRPTIECDGWKRKIILDRELDLLLKQ
jgi:hypothetical protein